MNKQEWFKFYSVLRKKTRVGWEVNSFPSDFTDAYASAVPDEVRRWYLWARNFEYRLWHLAFDLYGMRTEVKVGDWYYPLTLEYTRRIGYGKVSEGRQDSSCG